MTNTVQNRLNFLDALRGMAVIWMVIFHFCYDLKNFGFIAWDFRSGFWYGFPRVIAFTFLLCVGLSLHYGHIAQFKKKSFLTRSAKLFIASLVISAATYVAFPNAWIYFGTLHCIFVGSVLGLGFVYHRKIAIALMVLIMIAQYILGFDIEWVSANITKQYSMDFIPIYPWFWVILLGIVIAPYLADLRELRKFRSPPFLKWLGLHSLKIYLIHQPVIFASLWLVQYFLR